MLIDLVVRGGYGIYANRTSFGGQSTNRVFEPPFTFSRSLIGGANSAASLQSPFPVLPPSSSFPNFIGDMLFGPPYAGDRTTATATVVDPDFKESTVQQYGFDIQYQHKTYLLSLGSAAVHDQASKERVHGVDDGLEPARAEHEEVQEQDQHQDGIDGRGHSVTSLVERCRRRREDTHRREGSALAGVGGAP